MITVFLASLAILAGESAPVPSTSANQPGSSVEAKMLVERAKQEIAQEEKSWTEETAREKEAEARRRKRFADFSQDRLRLQQTLAGQEETLKASLAKMEAHQFKERELTAHFKQLSQVLQIKTRELRAALATGIPYRLDKRLESLDLLARDIEGGNISPEEAMNRLWTFEQTERRLAQEAEVFTGDFAEGSVGAAASAGSSDPIQVKYLRIGKQVLAFSSLDGSRLGILKPVAAPATGYVWVREQEMDHATRQALKLALSTADGKSLPGFVGLPIWKTAFPPLALATQGQKGPVK